MQRFIYSLALLGAVLCAQAVSSGAADEGKIIFPYSGLTVVRPDGSNATQISGGDDRDPDFNRDGSKIVFTRFQNFGSKGSGAPQIYTSNADGSNATRLTFDQAQNFGPKWSPDGTQIVFASNRADTNPVHQGAFEIYVINADGTNPRRLTRDRTDDFAPDFSPDGTQIVFSSSRAATSEGSPSLFVMNADGANVRALTPPNANDFQPVWSPDGARIAFVSINPSNFSEADIYTLNVADALAGTPNRTRLTSAVGLDYFPTWSPDGQQLAFVSNRDRPDEFFSFDVFVTGADGTNPHKITAATSSSLSWGPGDVPAPGLVLLGGSNGTERVRPGESSTSLSFFVKLGRVLNHDVTFGYATIDGSAQVGSDYKAVRARGRIPAGQQFAIVRVPIINDKVIEDEETFSLTLFEPRGTTIIAPRADASIQDDDRAPILTLDAPKDNGIYRQLTEVIGHARDANFSSNVNAYVSDIKLVLYRFETTSRGQTYPAGFFEEENYTFTPDLTAANLLFVYPFENPWTYLLPRESDGFVSGRYLLTATARDASGNQTTVDSHFVLDNEPPTVSMTTPTPNARLFNAITLRGKVRDMAAGTRAVTCTVYRFPDGTNAAGFFNGQDFSDATFNARRNARPATVAQSFDGSGQLDWSLALPSLPLGRYYVRTFAEDLAGNRAATGFVRFSVEPPTREPSTASASVVRQTIRLIFVRSLDAARGSGADSFRILVNGRLKRAVSVDTKLDGHTIELGLAAGTLKAGDKVVVAFKDLPATDGGPISGQTEVLTAQ